MNALLRIPPFTRIFATCAVACLITAGCAKNSILDVEIVPPVMPADVDDPVLMTVAVRGDTDPDFELPWAGTELEDAPELSLDRAPYQFSVESTDIAPVMYLKLNYTTDPADPSVFPEVLGEVWVTIEKPFYQGEFTELRFDFPGIPQCNEDCTEPVTEGVPEGCTATVQTPTSMSGRAYPVWECMVTRCEVGCTRVGGGGSEAGSCTEGLSGPHYCE